MSISILMNNHDMLDHFFAVVKLIKRSKIAISWRLIYFRLVSNLELHREKLCIQILYLRRPESTFRTI